MSRNVKECGHDNSNLDRLDRVFEQFEQDKLKRKRERDIDAMLAEWRKANGCCPHCGKQLG